MNYLSYGNADDPTVLLIHGLASTAETCYAPVVPALVGAGWHVVLAEVDGHGGAADTELVSLDACCADVERFVARELGGRLRCLGGFSMGASMAVKLAGRANVRPDRLFLDAALVGGVGAWAGPFTALFTGGVAALEAGLPVPRPLLDACMGKGNTAVIDMLWPQTSLATVRNACRDLYRDDIPAALAGYTGPVAFWRGSNEPFPARSAQILREGYLPQLEETAFERLGHGQWLHEHPGAYARGLIEFLAG